MSEDHWSDKGKNAGTFNAQTSKDAELEKNKASFREAHKTPEPKLELNPPWAGTVDAAADRARRDVDMQSAANERKKQQQEAIKEDQAKVQFQKQIDIEKKQHKQELSDQDEIAQQTRRDALRTEAEYKRQQAQVVLADQERSSTQQSELDRYREQFRQAASPPQDRDKDMGR